MTVNLNGVVYDVVVIEESVVALDAPASETVVVDSRAIDVVEVERPSQAVVLTASGQPQVLLVDSPGGPKGDIGPPGPPGPSGQPRWEGDGPPGLIIGSSPGDLYLDRTTGDLYRLE